MAPRTRSTGSKSRWCGWSSGQATTEFPIAALAAVLFTIGIVFGGVAIYSYNFVSQAARDATRYAAVNGSKSLNPVTSSDVQTFVRNEATGLNTNNITVSTTWNPDNNPGSTVEVLVKYTFQPFYPISGTTLTMASQSEMVISR